MRIVFMGTPDFAVPCLQKVLDLGHDVVGVFTQPDKPVGRKQILTPPPVKQLALEHNIPVFQPAKMRDGTALQMLQELRPDLAVVVAYGRILPPDLLAVPPLGCINIHGSLLPHYRGAAPIQWTVLNGEPTGGVTSMFMDEGLDTGDIILKKETPVGPDETSGELFDRLCLLGADCLAETLALIAEGKAPRTPQNHDEATLAPILNKEMARIDFSKTAREVHNLVRGMSPWPTAFTKCGEKLLKVHQSRLVPELEGQTCGQPGQLIGDGKDFVVACGSGALRLTVVQLEGKGRLDGETFLRGSRLEPGFVLG
jgi:methionyl-tRNA formyltransferase